MVGEGIGHEGHNKVVIWRDDGEIIILKIERNDKYCHHASFSNFYFSLFSIPFLIISFPFISTVSTTRHFNPIEDY